MTDIARLAELEAAATKGPWHRHTYGHRTVRQAAGVVTRALFHSTHTDLSFVHSDGPDGEGPSVCLTGNGPKQTDNADLIAAWRNAAPAILEVLRAAPSVILILTSVENAGLLGTIEKIQVNDFRAALARLEAPDD